MKRSSVLPPAVRRALSPLESRVLDLLPPGRTKTVREIHETLSGDVALTSVAVTLDRLHKMGLVDRRAERCQGGIRYLYTPRSSPGEFERELVKSAVNRLIERFGSTAQTYFDERFGARRNRRRR